MKIKHSPEVEAALDAVPFDPDYDPERHLAILRSMGISKEIREAVVESATARHNRRAQEQ